MYKSCPFLKTFLLLILRANFETTFEANATDFGAFTEPELIFHADEQDKINRRERVKKILESPEYLSPAIVDDEDYIAEIYNMHVLPYQGFYIGFPTCGVGTSSHHSITPRSRSSDLILFAVATGSTTDPVTDVSIAVAIFKNCIFPDAEFVVNPPATELSV